MKKFLFAAGLALASTQTYAALAMGDIAFTSFNADEDGFSIVALADIASSSTVYFQDNEWGGSAFNTGESAFKWVSGSSVIAAGTVVRFTAIDVAARAASIGTFTASDSTNFGFSAGNEALYAFTGTSHTAPTAFLAAISSDPAVNLTLAGFSIGVNAIVIPTSSDYAVYTGLRNNKATFAGASGYGPQVNQISNWTVQIDGASVAGVVPSTTAFTVTPVPEPAEYAMLGLGLALVGAVARKRNQKK